MASFNNPSIKDQYKDMMKEDIRIKSNDNQTWLYLTEYQTELAMFCTRECLQYLERNGEDEHYVKVKKTVFVNATIAMMELAPWIFHEMAASVSRNTMEMMLAQPTRAKAAVEAYFSSMPSRPALAKDWERFDIIRHFAEGIDK